MISPHHHPVPPLPLAPVHRPVCAAQGFPEAGPGDSRDAECQGRFVFTGFSRFEFAGFHHSFESVSTRVRSAYAQSFLHPI